MTKIIDPYIYNPIIDPYLPYMELPILQAKVKKKCCKKYKKKGKYCKKCPKLHKKKKDS